MERRHKIMFALLGVLVAVALYQNIGFLKGGKPKPRRVAAPITTPKPAPTPAPVALREETDETQERKATPFQPIPVDPSRLQQLLAKGAWGREPFFTIEELRAPKMGPGGFPVTLEEVVALPITLSAVLISEGQRVAVINDRLYSVGENIPGAGKIVEITPDGISLESGRTLRLRESPIEVKSRER